jgi:hypothetical protein
VNTAKGSQYATVSTSSSYQSSSDKRVHFGLGADGVIKSVEIHWPSGTVQTLHDVAVDRILKIDEAADPSANGVATK